MESAETKICNMMQILPLKSLLSRNVAMRSVTLQYMETKTNT